MPKKILFIVYTPLQLINCIEFYLKKRKNLESNLTFFLVSHPDNINKLSELTLKLTPSPATIVEFDYLSLQKNSFVDILFSKISSKEKVLNVINNHYDYLIHSSVDKYFIRFVSKNSFFNERFIVDDGLATLFLLRQELSKKRNKKKLSDFFKSMLKIMEGLVYGMPPKYDFSNYGLFSAFSEVNEIDFKIIIKNDYLELKRKIIEGKGKILSECVHFIGQPLTELGLVVEKEYFDALKIISDKFSDLEYYPHPGESHEKLERLSKKGIKIVSGVYGYEAFILQANYYPSRILTFYSSAIVVLHKILFNTGINVGAIKISSEFGFSKMSKAIDMRHVYNEIYELGIPVIVNKGDI